MQLGASLLLVHGLLDENVHFRHTARLINALTAAAKVREFVRVFFLLGEAGGAVDCGMETIRLRFPARALRASPP